VNDHRLSTSISSFLRAFGGRWFTLMSGPPTVPLAIIALYVENGLLRSLFVVLAVVCGAFSCYWVWRDERTARIAAEGRLKSRLKFVIEDCCRRQASLALVGVANQSAVSVEDARVYITIPKLQLDDRVLNWSGMEPDTGWNIHPGPGHAHTDPFLFAGDDGRFIVRTAYSGLVYVEPGDYVAELCVRGRNVAATTAKIEFTFGPSPRSMSVRLRPTES
jgi:hypothetical protein